MATIIGVFLCQYTAKAMGEHDHPSIVCDEIVGYGFAMFLYPSKPFGSSPLSFYSAYSTSGSPIGWSDKKLTGGTGIMMDDVIAGI